MITFRNIKYALALTSLVAVGTTAAMADTPSGMAIAVIQSTQAQGSAGDRTLEEQGPVYSGDKIVTGPSGQAQIKFRDETKLVVGPNSSLTIDAFVYSGKAAREVSIDAVKGAFRFITGVSKKDAYSITTPTAVIAVRGTEFDFTVDRGGGTEVVMFGGVTLICPKTLAGGAANTNHQDCVQASQSCGMTIIPPSGGDISQLKASEQRNALINSDFRYIRDQDPLNPQFKLNIASCGHPATFRNLPYAQPPSTGGGTPPAPSPSEGEGSD
jgi:hypothetical protein